MLSLIPMLGSTGDFIQFYSYYSQFWLAVPLALFMTKAFHELGHAAAVIHFGGTVKYISLTMLAMILPLPKTETRNLHKIAYRDRVVIALAGMYFEAILALVCLWAWLVLNNELVRVIAHFIVGVALPMSIVMNALPVMKFDGYQALTAALKHPKLYEDAITCFRRTAYHCLGLQRPAADILKSSIPQSLLAIYGAVIIIWKLLIPIGIAAAISVFIDARIMLALAALPFMTIIILPGINEVKRMKNAAKQLKWPQRFRLCLAMGLLIAVALYITLPLPHVVTAKADIVQHTVPILAPRDGRVAFVAPDGPVSAGDNLFRIINDDVDTDSAIFAEQARFSDATDLPAHLVLRTRQRSVNAHKAFAYNDSLTSINSPAAGEWQTNNVLGVIGRSQLVGNIVTSRRELLVYIDARHAGSETVQGNLVTSQSILPVSLVKQGYFDDSLLPEYSSISAGKGKTLYTVTLDSNVPGQNAVVYFKRTFSLLFEFISSTRY